MVGSGASSQLKEAGPLSQGRFGIVGSTCSSQRQGTYTHTCGEKRRVTLWSNDGSFVPLALLYVLLKVDQFHTWYIEQLALGL